MNAKEAKQLERLLKKKQEEDKKEREFLKECSRRNMSSKFEEICQKIELKEDEKESLFDYLTSDKFVEFYRRKFVQRTTQQETSFFINNNEDEDENSSSLF